MSNPNFLNKNYTKFYNHSPHQHSSKTFLPAHYSSALPNQNPREPASQILVYSPSNSLHNNSLYGLASNHCLVHTQQLIRHLCLDCIQLLCSQCINEHIAVHRDNNSFPNIQTLKQLKSEMNRKLEELQQFMVREKNHPKNMVNSVDNIRKESAEKIDRVRNCMVELVEEWAGKLKSSIINSVDYQQIKVIQQEMYTLYEQINQLNSSLNSNGISVHDVKKAYQIDAERLQKCYKEMMEKYNRLSNAMKVQIEVDTGKFIQGLNQTVLTRIGGGQVSGSTEQKQQIVKMGDENSYSESFEQKQLEDLSINIETNTNLKTGGGSSEGKGERFSSGVPLMYSMICGTDILKIVDPLQIKKSYVGYQLSGISCYPLNSLCLLSGGRVVISGGMIAQNKKSDIVQIYDYREGKLVREGKLARGRSSHRTIVDDERIYFIGGFTPQNEQCKQIEVLKSDGMIETLGERCHWGGPNLAIKVGNLVVKITLSGVEVMDLGKGEWCQITSDVPFALSKGMQIASYINKQGKQMVIIFGDDQYAYTLDIENKVFIKSETGINKAILCSTTKNNKIYGWIDDDEVTVVCFDGKVWVKNVGN